MYFGNTLNFEVLRLLRQVLVLSFVIFTGISHAGDQVERYRTSTLGTMTTSEQFTVSPVRESIYLNASELRQLQAKWSDSNTAQFKMLVSNQLETVIEPVSNEHLSRRVLSFGFETSTSWNDILDMETRIKLKGLEGESLRTEHHANIGYDKAFELSSIGLAFGLSNEDSRPALSNMIDVYAPHSNMQDFDDIRATRSEKYYLTINANLSRLSSEVTWVNGRVSDPLHKNAVGAFLRHSGDVMTINYIHSKVKLKLSGACDLYAQLTPISKQSHLNAEQFEYTAYKIGAKTNWNKRTSMTLEVNRSAIDENRLSGSGLEKIAMTMGYNFSSSTSLKLAMSQPLSHAFLEGVEARTLITAQF